MKILISGATGLVGRALSSRLFREGHDIVVLSRSSDRARKYFPVPAQFFDWDPSKGHAPEAAFESVDAVIHLAGESVADGRWTKERKKRIYDSRIVGAQSLISAIAALKGKRPGVFLSASAIGYYGDRGEEWVDEKSGPGGDFLAGVCVDWENETSGSSRLRELGIRAASLRTGIVLSSAGGALEKMVTPFRMGVGGPLGSGKQYMSWIHIDDLVEAYVHVLQKEELQGAVNAVAPNPATNREFSYALARVLKKSVFLRAPATVLKLALGEMGRIVLSGQRVEPSRLLHSGFRFRFDRLDGALDALLSPSGDIFEGGTWVPKPVETVFDFFSDAKNLEVITPPWIGFKTVSMSTETVNEGTLIDYRLKIHGVPVKWKTLIEDWVKNQKFVDVQLSGPYAFWEHTHSFEPARGGTWMKDRVIYRLPLGKAGRAVGLGKVRRDLDKIFEFRQKVIVERLS